MMEDKDSKHMYKLIYTRLSDIFGAFLADPEKELTPESFMDYASGLIDGYLLAIQDKVQSAEELNIIRKALYKDTKNKIIGLDKNGKFSK